MSASQGLSPTSGIAGAPGNLSGVAHSDNRGNAVLLTPLSPCIPKTLGPSHAVRRAALRARLKGAKSPRRAREMYGAM